jgi:hypothetical protein
MCLYMKRLLYDRGCPVNLWVNEGLLNKWAETVVHMKKMYSYFFSRYFDLHVRIILYKFRRVST